MNISCKFIFSFILILFLIQSDDVHAMFFSAKKLHKKNEKLLSKQQLDYFYEGINAFHLAKNESEIFERHKSASTYGEITYDAMQFLIEKLHLTKKDVFYDLGSGKGQFPIQVYCNSKVKKSVGIELSNTRHKHALMAKEKMEKSNFSYPTKKLIFIEGDMVDPTIDISDATVIWMNSTCYPQAVMEEIMKKFVNLKKGTRVVTLKKLPFIEKYKFKHIDTLTLPMTWSSNVTTHIYKRI